MNKRERQIFIETMKKIGDVWEDKDVKRVYGKNTLKDALEDRMGLVNTFASIIGTILNK